MQLQTTSEGEAVPKLRRTRKRHWRNKWIALTKGTSLDSKAILHTMRGPKLLSAAMPRVILKEEHLRQPRSAESEFGLKFEPPKERKELADFIGCSAAAGIFADDAEAEFFSRKWHDNRGGFGKKNAIKKYGYRFLTI
jgi:hypothetical protein